MAQEEGLHGGRYASRENDSLAGPSCEGDRYGVELLGTGMNREVFRCHFYPLYYDLNQKT